MRDILGRELEVGHRVAYAVFSHKRVKFRIGEVRAVDETKRTAGPIGSVLVYSDQSQMSTWKAHDDVARVDHYEVELREAQEQLAFARRQLAVLE